MSENSSTGNIILNENNLTTMKHNSTVNKTLTDYSLPEFVQAIMIIMYAVISIAAIGGNIIVCYIVISYQRMRTVTNYFIMNLAVADIMMAMICIPFTFVSALLFNYWPFGSFMCPVVTYAQAISVFLSAYTLVAISIDRYIAILYPLKPRMTKLQAKMVILFVWIVSLLTPLPIAILSQVLPDEYGRPQCNESWEFPNQRYIFSMVLMTLQYFFPLSVLIYTYIRIAFCVWSKKAPGEAENTRDQRMAASKRKMIKMMIVVVIVFALSWLPLNLFQVVTDKFKEILRYKNINYIWFACHWSAMSHACCNPFIYSWMNSTFRDGFRQVFRFLPFVSKVRLEEHSAIQRSSTFTTSMRSNSYSRVSTRLSAAGKEDSKFCHLEDTPIKIDFKNENTRHYSDIKNIPRPRSRFFMSYV